MKSMDESGRPLGRFHVGGIRRIIDIIAMKTSLHILRAMLLGTSVDWRTTWLKREFLLVAMSTPMWGRFVWRATAMFVTCSYQCTLRILRWHLMWKAGDPKRNRPFIEPPRRKCPPHSSPENLFQLNAKWIHRGRGYFSPPRRESRPPHKNVPKRKKIVLNDLKKLCLFHFKLI